MTRTVIIPAVDESIEGASDYMCYTSDDHGVPLTFCGNSVRLPSGYYCGVPGFSCTLSGVRGIRCKESEVKDE